MSEQAPAGWYPDGHGNERYWDGSIWTEQLRQPSDADATSAGASNTKKDGTFSKFGSALKKAAAERMGMEEPSPTQAEDANAAGSLVTSGVFGTSTVEIYEGGYLRVASWREGMSATQAKPIKKNTPYEKLRSIKFTGPAQEQGPNAMSALEGAVGPAVAGLVKGGKALMKGSAPGLAVAGLAHIASAKAGKSFLTITTDKKIHTLSNQASNGFVTTSNKGHNEVGIALEAAGNSVLGTPELTAVDPVPISMAERKQVVSEQAAAGSTLAERLRELAELHKDGILSDEEFAAAKGKLLGAL